MIRGALLALLLLPLGCSVNTLPGSASTRLGNSDGGTVVDLGPGNHGDGGGCGGGGVDLATGDGGPWSDGGGGDGWGIDFGGGGYDGWGIDFGGGGYDGGPIDAGHVDLAH